MPRILKKIFLYFFLFVSAALLTWIGHLALLGPDAVILMYHSIGEEGLAGQKTMSNVSLETFEKQMRFLHDRHYRVISLGELAALRANGRKAPAKTVVITFDDGYENNYTKAYPILKKYGFPATMFVVTDFLGTQQSIDGHAFRFMTPAMLREMAESGRISIGSHTKTHLYLPDVKEREVLWEEIRGSKDALEKILGRSVEAFSYPVGGYTPQAKKMVQQAGYKFAVTTLPYRKFGYEDVFVLKRIKVTERAEDPLTFFTVLSGYYVKMKEMHR